jgi:UTP--glucose-1-phosphate uridylyltransferase
MSPASKQNRIRIAVFPVAGLGTRFLPATKTVPKEMLPVIDKPLIQYAVDEAVEAGCDTLVFITNRYKHAVADYFDKAYELEQKLERAARRNSWTWCATCCHRTCARYS